MIDLALLPILCYAAGMTDRTRRCRMENTVKPGGLRAINFSGTRTWSRHNPVPDIRLP
ncbi:MAG: hypothetical protein FD175_2547 [Beijerinckiaceae bacterium]|nr:MAG: hypothetical protein FD175_2547 [Beijerinckiaceae bacterium]